MAVGPPADAPANVFVSLESGDDGVPRARSTRRGLRPDEATAALLFGPDSPPRRRSRSTSSATRCSWWPRPAGALVDGDPPASALVIEVKRHAPRKPADLPLPEPLAEPRLDFRVDRASALVVRGARGRVHPGDRRAGPPVLGLPRLPPREAREGARARDGRRDHAHADGRGVPAARALPQVLRRGHGPARPGGARHGRPPRHVRARLHAALLRGHGLPRPRELHGQLQRAGATRTGSPRAPAGRPSTSSSTPGSRRTTCSSRTSRGRVRATTCC